MEDIMRGLIQRRQAGELCGIPSFCTANPIVIEACLRKGKEFNQYVLIEATANQVNQYGGYTGMHPTDFKDMVIGIADKVGFNRERLILGGDHLGPLTWSGLEENQAMENAKVLVKEFVKAGFKKIHLDTSMRLSSDDPEKPLPDEVIAWRGAVLYAECERAYEELLLANPDEQRPTFIIGSEVPIPGGTQKAEDAFSITEPESLNATLKAYENAFEKIGLKDAFNNIVGVVVQPGVEFGNESYSKYNHSAAANLLTEAKRHSSITLEGHSTDYQSPESLREMVQDGIAILKVGPALTFALREGLFALSMIEAELFDAEDCINLPAVLENAMLANPIQWQKYYHGDERRLAICRKYSYSDRCRYYLKVETVEKAMYALLNKMSRVDIPLNMLHQYMPLQYERIRREHLENSAVELIMDYIGNVAQTYFYATTPSISITDIIY